MSKRDLDRLEKRLAKAIRDAVMEALTPVLRKARSAA